MLCFSYFLLSTSYFKGYKETWRVDGTFFKLIRIQVIWQYFPKLMNIKSENLIKPILLNINFRDSWDINMQILCRLMKKCLQLVLENPKHHKGRFGEKSCIPETKNLSTDADCSTNIFFVGATVKEACIFFAYGWLFINSHNSSLFRSKRILKWPWGVSTFVGH